MKNMIHLASRLFGTPLLIHPGKLESILAAIGPRLGLEVVEVEAAAAPVPGQPRKSYQVTDSGIAIISIMGPLVNRASGNFLSGGPTTYGEVETEFMDAATDPAIKGIVLDADSPGGEVSGCFDLSDLIYSARGMKPIFAVANDSAFSAMYALASSADEIYCTRTGGVGSIGVVAMHCDQSAFDEKIGAKYTYIHFGARKVDGNPHGPLADQALASFQAEVDRVGELFVSTVARNRGLSPGAIKAMEAGLFYGETGVSAGLADHIGTLADAINDMESSMATPSKRQTFAAAAAANSQKEKLTMITENEASAAGTETPVPAPALVAAEAVAEPVTAQPSAQEIEAAGKNAGLEASRLLAKEINDLCKIAGKPALAGDFITNGTTLAEVRKQLLDARAKDGETGGEISSEVSPIAGGGIAQMEVEAATMAKAQGITKEQAFANLLRANPQVYEQYSAAK